MNIHDLMKDLTEHLNLSPEDQFRVTAKIKRYVHSEKIGVYSRIRHYANFGKYRKAKGRRIKNKARLDAARWIKEFADLKVKTHMDLARAEDKQIVSWDVGTHVYQGQVKP